MPSIALLAGPSFISCLFGLLPAQDSHDESAEEVVEQGARLGVLLGFPSQLLTSYRLWSQKRWLAQNAQPEIFHAFWWVDWHYLLSPSFPTVEVVNLHHNGYAQRRRGGGWVCCRWRCVGHAGENLAACRRAVEC